MAQGSAASADDDFEKVAATDYEFHRELADATGNRYLRDYLLHLHQVATRFVDGRGIQEGAVNRVSALVRAYDPCLSCSTHAVGQMPLVVQVVDAGGAVVTELRRG